MKIREGDRVRSILTEKIYEVKSFKDRIALLESEAESIKLWTEKDNLRLFYGKVEGGKSTPRPPL